MDKRKESRKIERARNKTGALASLHQMEKKLMRRQLSKSSSLQISPNPRRLFSFKASF